MLALLTSLVALTLFPITWSLVVYFRDVKKLRRFPAPSFAGITNLWAANCVRYGKRSLEVHKAHQRLGPIVRIQPEHLSFNLPEAVQDIYGFSQHLLKDTFYDTVTGNEYASIVGTRSRENHARKRKYVSNAYVLEPFCTQQKLHMLTLRQLRTEECRADGTHRTAPNIQLAGKVRSTLCYYNEH